MSKKTPAAEPATPEPGDATKGSAAEPATAPNADPFAHVNDPHWGKGGRFTVVDGKRVPVTATETEATHG